MGKMPSFQFYPGDWRRDTQVQKASFLTRGVWIEMLCCMWDAPERGILKGTVMDFSRLLGCNIKELRSSFDELNRLGIADIEVNNTDITVKNRRMVRERLERESNRKRQERFRIKGGGSPEKWNYIRSQILERDEYMCAYCGRKADTVDHIYPKIRGGDESNSNLVACCKRCNMKKTDKTLEEAGMTFWKGFDIKKLQNNANITPILKHQNNTKITPPSSVFSLQSSGLKGSKEDSKESSMSPEAGDEPEGKSDKIDKKKQQLEAWVDETFNYWINKLAKKCYPRPERIKKNEERTKHIRARLNSGYKVEDLKAVIDFVSMSDFHLGDNDRGNLYIEPYNIMGNNAKVDKNLAKATGRIMNGKEKKHTERKRSNTGRSAKYKNIGRNIEDVR